MNTPKDRYIAILTPEQWDCWLTLQADWLFNPNRDNYSVYLYHAIKRIFNRDCPICAVFGYEWDGFHPCNECFSGNIGGVKTHAALPCQRLALIERIDYAIAKLEAAGVWED